MGPILIFDKSALQSFSIDESVWLQNYFLSNITPLFYIETLADLSLTNPSRPAQKIISEIAAKTPSAQPNVHHYRLVLGDLLGHTVEMSHGRPIIDRGITRKSSDGKIGVHFDESSESKAMARWHKREYTDIEREFAKKWRQTLNVLNYDAAIGIVKNIIPAKTKLSSLEQIKVFIDRFVEGSSRELISLAMDFLGIEDRHRLKILERWQKEGNPGFSKFAPYASYVFSVDLLLYLGTFKGMISKDRPTNKVDLAYLYYLPFCHVFTSGDKLHARTVPLFMKKNQTFILASQLKEALSDINKYYLQFKDQIDKVGVMKFTAYPPIEINTPLHKIWDTHCPDWRVSALSKRNEMSAKPVKDSALLKRIREFEEKSEVINRDELKSMDEADHVIVKHMMPVQKGSWRILPQGIEDD